MKVTVIVPTYQRPGYLKGCLEGLLTQSRPADQVVVVRREEDKDAHAILQAFSNAELDEVTVDEPGVLVALHRGLKTASGEIIAFMDDDAAPHADWLERLLAHLDEPAVGGVGGRDLWVSDEAHRDEQTEDVGRVTRWGKLVGNHHIGIGPARDVMV